MARLTKEELEDKLVNESDRANNLAIKLASMRAGVDAALNLADSDMLDLDGLIETVRAVIGDAL